MLLSIDHRVLLAVGRGFSQLRRFLRGLVVEVFYVYTTAVPYLRHRVVHCLPLSLSSPCGSFVRWSERRSPLILSLFLAGTTLSQPLGFVFSSFPSGESSRGRDSGSSPQGAVEPAPPSRGFYSCFFVVTKVSGGWRLIIDLSTLISSVVVSELRMVPARCEGTTAWWPSI